MRKMRFFRFLISLLLCFILLTSCGKKEVSIDEQIRSGFEKLNKESFIINDLLEEKSTINEIEIYNINDFHGAIEEDEGKYGASRTIEYLKNEYNDNPGGTIMGINGDLFQGSALSNYRHGLDLINIFNLVPIDYMVVGNHEFDWGLDEVLKYFDGDKSNGEANFPLLACNIYDSTDDELVDGLKPYVILNKGQYKIGVIGYIGYGLESEIAVNRINNYYFKEPSSLIQEYSKELRTLGCDMIIASGHDSNESLNSTLATFGTDSRIDCILNGHSHSDYTKTLNGACGNTIPVVQSKNVGKKIGHIVFTENDDMFTCTLSTNQDMSTYDKNSVCETYISRILEITAPMFQRVLTTCGKEVIKYSCIDYINNFLMEYTGAEASFINAGGVREYAFPIKKNDKVTVAKIYEIVPFDNYIVTCKIKGSDLIYASKAGNLVISDNFLRVGTRYFLNEVEIELDKYYTVATVDFVYDQSQYPFKNGTDYNFTGLIVKDLFVQSLEKIGTNGVWKIE